jgi:hypothetical protein
VVEAPELAGEVAMSTDPRESYGRLVNDTRRAFAAEQVEVDDRGRRRRFLVAEWDERAPSQRELDMRIGSAVAVRAVHDAGLELDGLRAEVMRYRAELDALEKHRPAAMGALRARLAVSPHGGDAKPYRAALEWFRGSEEEGTKP